VSHLPVIRAWKDPEYRLSLSEADLGLLPNHPAGLIDLTEADMNPIAGGGSEEVTYSGCTCVLGCTYGGDCLLTPMEM